nr:GNAT family N-acetyltransferase [uncultured Rhodopila sp.]
MTIRTLDFFIRDAERAELRACRMLLPETFSPGNAPEALVAFGRHDDLAGAAAIGWQAVGDPAAFPVSVHVLPKFRRQGLGRALLDAAAALARGEAAALQPWTALREDSEAAAFCLACGFGVHHRILHFSGEAERMEAMLAAYREKLDRSGWIPAGARVVALPDAPPDEVANLVAREFHNHPERMLARLSCLAGTPPDPQRSVVLLLDGMVVGAQLVSIAVDGVPEVEANVVIPSLRRGWANLLLTHEGTRIGVLRGSRRFRFFCDDRVIDTVNLARRSGAEKVATDVVLRRAVA